MNKIFLIALAFCFCSILNASERPSLTDEPIRKEPTNSDDSQSPNNLGRGILGSGLVMFSIYAAFRSCQTGIKALGWSTVEGITDKIDAGVQTVKHVFDGQKDHALEDKVHTFKRKGLPLLKTALWGTSSVITFIAGARFLKQAIYNEERP